MNLFIDESKLFIYRPKPNSWSVVACYAVSDDDYIQAQNIIKELKISAGFDVYDEVKVNDLSESQYIVFLKDLQKLGGTLYAVATDSGLNTPDVIHSHQVLQGDKIVEHKEKMKYEERKRALENLRERVVGLSPQLYVQLFCQLNLMVKVINTVIPYYIQRDPRSLSRFQWRVDQKDVTRTDFENVFEILGPRIIQSKSITDPLMMIKGFDYSVLNKYEYTKDNVPKYLKEQYGLNIESGYNIQAIIREDIDFVDSKNNIGVQIIDLLVSGLRKCLRLEFSNNSRIAFELGKLMVQARHNSPPIDLVCLSTNTKLAEEVANLIRIMIRVCRPFLTF